MFRSNLYIEMEVNCSVFLLIKKCCEVNWV